MSIPGFSAEASLYKTHRYVMTTGEVNPKGEAVVEPQQLQGLSDMLRFGRGRSLVHCVHTKIFDLDPVHPDRVYESIVCNGVTVKSW